MDPNDPRILNDPGCSEEPEMKKQKTCEEGTEPRTEIFTDSTAEELAVPGTKEERT